ncbi:unnamed protein product [Periconia digitata]|uniref:Uncharacterized protein n=1 Tax=Periconia digitata TaxID=1303443 RepID=A0A9W4XID3_9PLEO|nr:unnamed protein product [Periconia digitata]
MTLMQHYRSIDNATATYLVIDLPPSDRALRMTRACLASVINQTRNGREKGRSTVNNCENRHSDWAEWLGPLTSNH